MIIFETLADFGKYKNLKTDESTVFLNSISQIDPNYKVLCRDFKFKKKKTNFAKFIPFGRKIPQFLTLFSIFPLPVSIRLFTLKLLDYFGARKITKSEKVLICIPTPFLRSIRKIHKQGGIAVLFSTTAHPKYNAKLTNTTTDPFSINSLKEADYILSPSNFVTKTCIDAGIEKKRIVKIILGRDISRYKPKKKKDKIFRVLAVGNYGKLKGFQYLLQAWKELNLKDSELVIVGNPNKEMLPIINEYKKQLKNFRAVPFTKDVISYYQNCSVLVHPSLTEGSARIIIEAMACAKPVIATQMSNDALKDGKNGFVIPQKKIKPIKEKLLFLYKHPKIAEKMGIEARELIEKEYSNEASEKSIKKALNYILTKEGLI